MKKLVYDFIDERGHNVIDIWLKNLDPALRGRMKSKIDALMNAEDKLPPKMLTDTKETHIKELCVNSKEALRLLLCKGPTEGNIDKEFTLLYGATERDRKYVPGDALKRAEERRQLVIGNPIKYRRRRQNAYSEKS